VALTKIDRVDASRLSEATGEIRTLLAGSSLSGSPVFPVSAATGEGVDALKSLLVAEARACPPRASAGNFRLAIDRCFRLTGTGLIVTGTAVSGVVSVGDQVRLLLAGVSARVRSIHAQNRAADAGKAGQRCALNLSGPGLKYEDIQRGDWVVTGGVPEPVTKFDALLRIPATEQPFEHWTPVHLHLAAADVTGRIAILENDQIAPAASGLVQLVLDRPVGALRGDRFVIRDQSAQRTLGGGEVIDVHPPLRGRARPERLRYLAAMQASSDESALRTLLASSPYGLDLSKFTSNRNLTVQEASRLFATAGVKVVETPSGNTGFARDRWDGMKSAFLEKLADGHRRAPNQVALSEEHVWAESRLPREAVAALVSELVREARLIREPGGVRLPSHISAMSPADAALWKKTESVLRGVRPPSIHEAAAAVSEDPKKMEAFLARAAKFGLAVRVAPNRFFLPEALLELARAAEQVASPASRQFSMPAFRDHTGIGRGVTIEVLEYFDRIKFTRRLSDVREIVRAPADLFGRHT